MVSMAERPRPDTDPEGHTEAAPLAGVRLAQVTSTDNGATMVANRYEILGMLGSGGMGTVYRARDRELDEIVALKVLKKELASTSGMLERFRREVKLARRVTHKNVARTFDIGDHEGDRFLTMELIEGESLAAQLDRRGRVPLREVLAIGRDVCAGLAAAHAAGVLHRDLKPENVVLASDGRAVITDFGIARALEQAELARTAAGMVGTPAYMAPEQVEGAADLDARADLYALGVMLFELLSGKPAWPGDSIVAIAAGRLLKPPPDLRTHVPDLAEDVALVVLKLMARTREDRYATADEAGEALAGLASRDLPSVRSMIPNSHTSAGTSTNALSPLSLRPRAQRTTVAVLPLINLGVDDDAYLAQTVTEDLVDLLSVVPDLRVRPRGETLGFDTRTRDVREAGRALNVDVVVDGSLRRIEDVVRVSVRLVTVEDGFQLWAQRFDRSAGRVLTVADDAAAAIASALATELKGEARAVVDDPIAQDLYLRGRYLVHRGWFDVSRDGVAMLAEAHKRAPDDARIAGTYALAIARVLTADPDAMSRAEDARELAEKTLAADPSQVDARVALGFVHLNNAESVTAATQLKRALSQAPNAVEALDAVGRVLVEIGQLASGLAILHKALSIDPMMVHARQAIARAHALMGDYDSALETLGPLPPGTGDFTPHVLMRGRMAMWRDDRVTARELLAAVESSPVGAVTKQRLDGLLYIAVHGQAPANIYAQLDRGLPLDRKYAPRRLCFHAQMRAEMELASGYLDQALATLRIADDNGLLDLLWLEKCPLFERVRVRPEYVAIHKSTATRAERVREILEPTPARG
jgi:serine/threonine protein kinase/tetratricopeptide (TPR) repeat protein